MTARVELLRDLHRPGGRWLIVEGSEQSFVDVEDPTHLEFEYVVLATDVIDIVLGAERALSALHLGGGLATIPRWVAATRPGSVQRVAESSPAVLDVLARLPAVPGTEIVPDDALAVLAGTPDGSCDLVVSDLYDGPETVTSVYSHSALLDLRRVLRPDGVLVANLSDASPFRLARAVTATMRTVFADVAVLAEPSVLRSRRSGNLVLVGAMCSLPVSMLTRRAAGGVVRGRVMAATDLDDWVGAARPVEDAQDLPRSGESPPELLRLGRPDLT